MKILGIDINSKGIKIPFSNYRIPIPVFVSGLISIFGVPAAASHHTETTGTHMISNDTCPLDNPFRHQTQASCSYLSMQYFDGCFIETDRSPLFINLKLRTAEIQGQLVCRTIDGTHRHNDALVLYSSNFGPVKRMFDSLSMIDFKDCFIEHYSSFQSMDPDLKNFQCQAKLTCKTDIDVFKGDQKNKDLYVLYRSADGIIDNHENSHFIFSDLPPTFDLAPTFQIPDVHPRIQPTPLTISSLTQPSRTGNKNILSKFRDIVTNVLKKEFSSRSKAAAAKKFLLLPPLQETINFGILVRIAEEDLYEDFRYSGVTNCFKSKMDKLSKEFSEEHLAMSTIAKTTHLYEQCVNSLESSYILALKRGFCISELAQAGFSIFKHQMKIDALSTKLKAAAMDCSTQINSDHEKMTNRTKFG